MGNSKKRCKQCKKYVPAESGIKVPAGFFCSHDHAIEFAKAKQAQSSLKQRKERERIKSMTVKDLDRESLPWQHKQTQKAFNRMRVLQELYYYQSNGLEPVCISCQKPLGGDQWCCGHYKTVGAHPELRYDPLNTHLQHNRNCNMGLSGDIKGYTFGLVDRHGKDKAAEIYDYLAVDNGPKKYTCDELEKNRAEYRKEIRQLEKIVTIV